MPSFLFRVVLSIVLAFILLVCTLYPRLIPWVLLGLYLSLAVRRWIRRAAERRTQGQHARALAATEAAEDQAYRRWRRQRDLAHMAGDGPPGEVQPAARSHTEQYGLGSHARPVPRARRWH